MVDLLSRKKENELSVFKYMGLLQTVEDPPAVYWQPSDRDYSKLTKKLKVQKLNKQLRS